MPGSLTGGEQEEIEKEEWEELGPLQPAIPCNLVCCNPESTLGQLRSDLQLINPEPWFVVGTSKAAEHTLIDDNKNIEEVAHLCLEKYNNI